MITDEEIEKAKTHTNYDLAEEHHEHNDCIRIAYQWLDAQKNTQGITSKLNPLKHLIEKWGGRYVSNSDVCVAAELHHRIKGKYPQFNISARLTEPSLSRLKGISEAMAHNYRDSHVPSKYKLHEE